MKRVSGIDDISTVTSRLIQGRSGNKGFVRTRRDQATCPSHSSRSSLPSKLSDQGFRCLARLQPPVAWRRCTVRNARGESFAALVRTLALMAIILCFVDDLWSMEHTLIIKCAGFIRDRLETLYKGVRCCDSTSTLLRTQRIANEVFC